jgi:hypothetical protein
MCQDIPCVRARVRLIRPFRQIVIIPPGAMGIVQREHLDLRQVDVHFDDWGLVTNIPEDFVIEIKPD